VQKFIIALAALVVCSGSAAAQAMEFTIQTLPDGFQFVFANGAIVPGDASKLRAALRSVTRDKWGTKQLALFSGGGDVDEALAMVKIMDREKVSTVVAPNMYCASACSQVVFISGFYRMVQDGGKIGLHTCSVAGKRDQPCNAQIGENAFAHGVAHGAVMAPMIGVSSDNLAWYSATDADCWGLTLWPPEYHRGIAPGDVAPCVREMMNRAARGAN
jgi:hypothetical protein